MSEAYTGFAEVYDTFMDNVPYDKWCEFVCDIFQKYGITPDKKKLGLDENTVLDLGCGTGKMTRMLRDLGFDMIGVDLSTEMLQIAREKEMEEAGNTLYLCQDMREFELYGTVRAVISICDSVNYLLEEQDVIKTFSLVNNYLYPKGIFVFDFNTVHKYRDVIGDTTIAENRENCSFIWENFYHEKEEINEYDLTIFVKDTESFEDGEEEDSDEAVPYWRFSETHYQRGYTLEQMKEFIKAAGMEFLQAFDGDTHQAVTDTSERIYCVARESGK